MNPESTGTLNLSRSSDSSWLINIFLILLNQNQILLLSSVTLYSTCRENLMFYNHDHITNIEQFSISTDSLYFQTSWCTSHLTPSPPTPQTPPPPWRQSWCGMVYPPGEVSGLEEESFWSRSVQFLLALLSRIKHRQRQLILWCSKIISQNPVSSVHLASYGWSTC